MDLDRALRALAKARKGLLKPRGRIARRNARRKVLGLLRRVRNAMDREYPVIGKPKPPPPPEPPEPPRPKAEPLAPLRPRRALSYSARSLFSRLAFAHYGIDGRAPFAEGWRALVHKLAYMTCRWEPGVPRGLRAADLRRRENDLAALYTKFWRGEVFVTDLELAAEHQAFIERHGGR